MTDKHVASQHQLHTGAWLLAIITVLISVYVWGDIYSWNVLPPDRYTWFPLFGLIAFGLMWTHYVVAAARHISGHPKSVIGAYYRVTSIMVLLSLLLHPLLLNSRLYADGYGLPPGSYQYYVAGGMTWVVTLGLVSLFIFLLFELHRFFSHKGWWKYIAYANDIAMLAIFYHGLRLGTHIQTGWFRIVWYFYGITLVALIFYLKVYIPRRHSNDKTP